MKKIFITLLITCICYVAQGQSSQTVQVESGDLAYNQGDKIAQLGISFGTYGYGYNYYGSRSFTLPIAASLEFGFHEYLSAGPYIGFASWRYDYINNVDYRFSSFAVGARGSFHYLPLINEALELGLDESAWDFYVTLMLGIEAYSWNFDNDIPGYDQANDTDFAFNAVVGFRYKFNRNWGVYFEGGRGAIGYITVGGSYTF